MRPVTAVSKLESLRRAESHLIAMCNTDKEIDYAINELAGALLRVAAVTAKGEDIRLGMIEAEYERATASITHRVVGWNEQGPVLEPIP